MSDPQQPKYGPAFNPQGGGAGNTDPDAGKDLGYLVPHLQVDWSTPPSFNQDPADEGGSRDSGTPDDVPPCGPIQVNLGTVRSAEQRMLGSARTVVSEYEALRNKVMSVKDTVFGQQATVETFTGGQGGFDGNSYNGAGAGVRHEQTVPSPLHDAAMQYAASINPAQEKVLWQIANMVEVVGQYLAGVNRAGQTYGHADRLSMFPEPPAHS